MIQTAISVAYGMGRWEIFLALWWERNLKGAYNAESLWQITYYGMHSGFSKEAADSESVTD